MLSIDTAGLVSVLLEFVLVVVGVVAEVALSRPKRSTFPPCSRMRCSIHASSHSPSLLMFFALCSCTYTARSDTWYSSSVSHSMRSSDRSAPYCE